MSECIYHSVDAYTRSSNRDLPLSKRLAGDTIIPLKMFIF